MEADAGISVKRRVRTAASLEALLNSCKTRRRNVRAWLLGSRVPLNVAEQISEISERCKKETFKVGNHDDALRV